MSAPSIFSIVVTNNGPLIQETNYWDSPIAHGGYLFFSVNAGCIRMLMPDHQGGEPLNSTRQQLDDSVFDATKYVIISRGHYGGPVAYEVLFEDDTLEPFVIFADCRQWDRTIPDSESGRTLPFHVYRRGCTLVRKFEGRFRCVNQLPCLRPWTARGCEF